MRIPVYSVIKYIRNKNRIPNGVMVAVKDGSGFKVAYSLCNKKDYFTKRMALNIALNRAEIKPVCCVSEGNVNWINDDPISSENTAPPMPQKVNQEIYHFLDRCKRYYK